MEEAVRQARGKRYCYIRATKWIVIQRRAAETNNQFHWR